MRGDVLVGRDAESLGASAVIDWRTVDRELRAIRQRRSALDAEEARWLREAEALQIWQPLGMVSALDYLERALGYAPRTAQDRLRVARALGDLPQLTDALASDALSFSAVRELTRVVTPTTEAAWIGAAKGKNLRQVEELVADHRPGDRPDDPPDPTARTHVVRFELSAETFARMRQARLVLDDEHGTNLSDDAFVAALCDAVLDGAPAGDASAPATGRARYQIAMTVCSRCRQGWQEAAAVRVAVDATAVDRAMCDAQHVGSLDGDAPQRAYQDIAPSVARFVWRRDGGRCRIDGCRSARGIEIHHIVHRADGGSHDPSNLILACSACHQAHHARRLMISGTADRLVVRRPGDLSGLPVPSGGAAGAHVGVVGTAVRIQAGGIDVRGSSVQVRASEQGAKEPRSRDGASEQGANGLCAGERARADVGVNGPGASGGSGAGAARIEARAPEAEDAGPGTIDMHRAATNRLDAAVLRAHAKSALTGMGWKPAIAHAAVRAAEAHGTNWTLDRLIIDALQRCPVPKL